MSAIVTENANLVLRTWEVTDAKAAFEFYGDPVVSRYIGDGTPAKSVDQVERMLRRFIEHQDNYGFSPWAVVCKQTVQVIGICGLHLYNEKQIPELGFRILRSHWGKGIATSASHLTIDFAWQKIGPTRIIARTFLENAGTQRVLEKVGFSLFGKVVVPELKREVLEYEILNPGKTVDFNFHTP